MQRRPIWISNILLFFLIFISVFFQFFAAQKFSAVNDFCQDYQALQNYIHQQSLYQLFSVSYCWQNLKFITYQYPAHPPTTLLFFIPLAKLSLSQATTIWDFANIFAYFLSLTCLLIYLHRLKLKTQTLIFLLSSIWLGLLISLASRNLIIFLTLLFSLSLITFQKKPIVSGFFIGIAALLKLWPIVLLFFPKNFKYTISGILTIFLGSIISLTIFGFSNHFDYLNKVLPFEHVFITSINNLSLFSLLLKTNFNPLFILIFISLLFYSIILFLKNYSTLEFDLFLTTLIILIFVFLPLSWDNSAIMLIIPLFVLIKNIKKYNQNNLIFFSLGFIPLLGPELLERASQFLPHFLYLLFHICFSSLPLFAFINFIRYNKSHESASRHSRR